MTDESLRRVHAVFFDAVGTLIHPDPPAPIVYQEIGQRHGSQLSTAEMRRRFITAFQKEEALDREQAWQTNEAREIERWRRIVVMALGDVPDSEPCFRELFAHFSQSSAWRCEAQVETVLQELSGRGYILGMASNYDSRLRSVASGLPVLAPLQHLVISSEVGWRKPAGEFFAAMRQIVGLPPDQVLYVGDDLVNDFDGAVAAGLHAVLFDPAATEESKEMPRIHRLTEMLPLLTGHGSGPRP